MSTPRPYGDSFVLALRKYLHDNHLTNLGQINNAEIIADLAQRFQDHWQEQQKQRKKRGDATPEEIAVYHAYPRLVGRADALAAIKGAREKGVDSDRLLAAATQYAVCVAKWPRAYRFTEGRDMVPYPATWFRAERYLDNPREWMPAGMFTRDDDPRAEGGGRAPPTMQLNEPEGWKEEYPGVIFSEWADVPQDSKRIICDHMNKQRI